MILEAIVTTRNDDGTTNVAPMGPRVDGGLDRFVLRPFATSRTHANLVRRREGVLHVTDDALLFAKTAIGLDVAPRTRPARAVEGSVLLDACRYYEFRVAAIDEEGPRPAMIAETVASGVLREFLGFNRARNAVIEAAILATRADWLPVAEMASDFARFAEIVRKTGGDDEHEALALLSAHVRTRVEARGESWREARS